MRCWVPADSMYFSESNLPNRAIYDHWAVCGRSLANSYLDRFSGLYRGNSTTLTALYRSTTIEDYLYQWLRLSGVQIGIFPILHLKSCCDRFSRSGNCCPFVNGQPNGAAHCSKIPGRGASVNRDLDHYDPIECAWPTHNESGGYQ